MQPQQAAFRLRAASSDVESSGASTKSSSILEDLKNAAMNLHTKDQAANGGQEAKKERPEVGVIERRVNEQE